MTSLIANSLEVSYLRLFQNPLLLVSASNSWPKSFYMKLEAFGTYIPSSAIQYLYISVALPL